MVGIDKAVDNFAQALAHQRRMTHAGIVIAAAAIVEAELERALKRAMQLSSDQPPALELAQPVFHFLFGKLFCGHEESPEL